MSEPNKNQEKEQKPQPIFPSLYPEPIHECSSEPIPVNPISVMPSINPTNQSFNPSVVSSVNQQVPIVSAIPYCPPNSNMPQAIPLDSSTTNPNLPQAIPLNNPSSNPTIQAIPIVKNDNSCNNNPSVVPLSIVKNDNSCNNNPSVVPLPIIDNSQPSSSYIPNYIQQNNQCNNSIPSMTVNLNIPKTSSISQDQMESIIRKYIDSMWFVKKNAYNEMKFNKPEHFTSYVISFDTFYETRSSYTSTRPCPSSIVDSSIFGSSPDKWSLSFPLPRPYKNDSHTLPLPHSSTIIPCYHCHSEEQTKCNKCQGNGVITCFACKDISPARELCTSCHGKGNVRCPDCNGKGTQPCFACQGCGRLEEYTTISCEYTNETNYKFVDESGLDEKSLKSAQGKQTNKFEGNRVSMPSFNFNNSVSESARSLFNQSDEILESNVGKLLSQQLIIKAVEITKLVGIYHETEVTFYIFGEDNQCVINNYPRSFNSLCSIF
ncbi:hypothetical protein WA158_006161 [Blastocystis sp. Blastoise]